MTFDESVENALRNTYVKHQPINRLLNPSLIDFIAQIQSYDYIPEVTKVALDMNMHASTVWKFMNTLFKRGLTFLGIPNLAGIGLAEIVVKLKGFATYEEIFKPLLREYAPILPKGTQLKYLIPYYRAKEYADVILRNQPGDVESAELYPYVVIGKPNLKRHFSISEGKILGNWSEILEIIESLPKESAPRHGISKVRIDEIDLYIIRRLEISPFESLRKVTDNMNKELSLKTPINYIRVLRHYKNRIEGKGLISGVRLNLTRLYPIDTLPLSITLKSSTTELTRLVKVLVTHPFFPEGAINPDGGKALVTGFIPLKEILSLSKFLDKLAHESLVKEWSITFLDYSAYRRLALPVRSALMSPEKIENISEDSPLITAGLNML